MPGSLVMKRVPIFAPLVKSVVHKSYRGEGNYTVDGNRVLGSVKVKKIFESETINSEVVLNSETSFSYIKLVSGRDEYELVRC